MGFAKRSFSPVTDASHSAASNALDASICPGQMDIRTYMVPRHGHEAHQTPLVPFPSDMALDALASDSDVEGCGHARRALSPSDLIGTLEAGYAGDIEQTYFTCFDGDVEDVIGMSQALDAEEEAALGLGYDLGLGTPEEWPAEEEKKNSDDAVASAHDRSFAADEEAAVAMGLDLDLEEACPSPFPWPDEEDELNARELSFHQEAIQREADEEAARAMGLSLLIDGADTDDDAAACAPSPATPTRRRVPLAETPSVRLPKRRIHGEGEAAVESPQKRPRADMAGAGGARVVVL